MDADRTRLLSEGTTVPEWRYTIDAGDHQYVVEGHQGAVLAHPLHYAVNDIVKFAIEKNRLFLLDSNGKVLKCQIIKVIKRDSDPKSPKQQ